MAQKDAFPDIHRVTDLPTRQALKTQADMVNAARAEARGLKQTVEARARELEGLRSEVSRLGGLKPILQGLNTQVNIANDHPWFILGISADQTIQDDPTRADKVDWDLLYAGNPEPYYDVDEASGYFSLTRKPGLWLMQVSIGWIEASGGTGPRYISASGGGWTFQDVRDASATHGTACTLSSFIPTHVPRLGGSWSRLRILAGQNSGGPLDLSKDWTYAGFYYLGPPTP